MSTFDGWETRLYGDAMALPSGEELMHFRTKGSKNGVRRYQQEDGTWTPLGLKERKAREGWGESRAERKAAKLQRKSERRAARKERSAAAKEAAIKKRAAKDLKNLSDEELQKRINRIKKEQEYKELTKNPMLKAGEKLVNSYFQNKDKQLERDMKKAELIVRQQEAQTKKIQAQVGKITAKTNRWDTITRGTKYKQAKANLRKEKANLIQTKAENTVGGAIKKNLNKILLKQGDRIVNDMSDQTIGRRAKNALKKSTQGIRNARAESKRRKKARRDYTQNYWNNYYNNNW